MLNSYLIPCNHCLISARHLKGRRVPRCLGAKCQSLHILVSTFYMLASVTINSLNHLSAQLPFRNHKSELHLRRAFICLCTHLCMCWYIQICVYVCTFGRFISISLHYEEMVKVSKLYQGSYQVGERRKSGKGKKKLKCMVER